MKDAATSITFTNRRRGGLVGTVARAVVVFGLWLGLVGTAAGGVAYVHYARGITPEVVRSFGDERPTEVTRFTAADGQAVGEWALDRRVEVPWEALPQRLILAFLAAEDARFFAHGALDLRGIARAALANLASGRITGGGSTITQQLAKRLVGPRKSLARKAREAILARRLEDLYSKVEILTMYLNSVYLGHHSNGVQAAAQNYFHKDVSQLTLGECALLAGLPQQPSRANPVRNPEAARRRQDYVLGQMVRWGWASEAEARDAKAAPWRLYARADMLGDHLPAYVEPVREEIARRYGDDADPKAWLRRGLQVSLQVEPGHQAAARRALRASLEDLAREQGFAGALGTLDRGTFFQRNARWLPDDGPPAPGARVLGRVASVTKTAAQVELGQGLAGSLPLKRTRWAGAYTEQPAKLRGKRRRRAKASFRPRLRDLRDALKPGDVVLVDVRGGQPGALDVDLVPVPLMGGALLSTPLAAGGLDAAVGTWDFDRSQVDRTRALRQTGSVMKPIVYSLAYDLGLPPSALFSGAPFREGKYNPTGKRTKDDMLVWDALVRSENSVSLRVLQYVLGHTSLATYRGWGERLGLSRPLQGNTAEVLGGDQTPESVLGAYTVFATRGLAPRLPRIRKVVDATGRVLERHMTPVDPHANAGDTIRALWDTARHPRARVVDEKTAYLTEANLVDVVRRGTGRRARKLGVSAAGKTGTLPYDVWFVGFTSNRAAVAWLGADRRRRTLGPSEAHNVVHGGDAALPGWLSYMQAVDSDVPAMELDKRVPRGVVHYRIDPQTGLLARSGGRIIPHVEGTEPKTFAPTPDAPSPDAVNDAETEF